MRQPTTMSMRLERNRASSGRVSSCSHRLDEETVPSGRLLRIGRGGGAVASTVALASPANPLARLSTEAVARAPGVEYHGIQVARHRVQQRKLARESAT